MSRRFYGAGTLYVYRILSYQEDLMVLVLCMCTTFYHVKKILWCWYFVCVPHFIMSRRFNGAGTLYVYHILSYQEDLMVLVLCMCTTFYHVKKILWCWYFVCVPHFIILRRFNGAGTLYVYHILSYQEDLMVLVLCMCTTFYHIKKILWCWYFVCVPPFIISRRFYGAGTLHV